jgi:hypothetical protein
MVTLDSGDRSSRRLVVRESMERRRVKDVDRPFRKAMRNRPLTLPPPFMQDVQAEFTLFASLIRDSRFKGRTASRTQVSLLDLGRVSSGSDETIKVLIGTLDKTQDGSCLGRLVQ